MDSMTWKTLTAGNYRVRIVWDMHPHDPLDNWDHGATVIPLELPRNTREDYYTSNDDTPEADIMRELLERMEREPEAFATVEDRAADSEEFTTGGGVRDMDDVADVFQRLTGRKLTVRQLTGNDQGHWATVAAWPMEDGEPATMVGGVLDVIEAHMRCEVYGLIIEHQETFANVRDSDDTVGVWYEIEACWGYEGDDWAASEARAILEHYAPVTDIIED